MARAANGFVQSGCGGQHQGNAQSECDGFLHHGVGGAQVVQHPQREQSGGNAAQAQTEHHPPRDDALTSKVHHATSFGRSSKQQIRAYGQRRLDAKAENQQRRHERAAPHAGQAHNKAHHKARHNECKIFHKAATVMFGYIKPNYFLVLAICNLAITDQFCWIFNI